MNELRVLTILLSLVLLLVVGCSAAEQGFRDGFEAGAGEEDRIEDIVLQILPKAEGEGAGVFDLNLISGGYLVVKYRMDESPSDKSYVLKQLDLGLAQLFDAVKECEGVEVVTVMVYLPSTEGEWRDAITVEVERETLEAVKWTEVDTGLEAVTEVYEFTSWLGW